MTEPDGRAKITKRTQANPGVPGRHLRPGWLLLLRLKSRRLCFFLPSENLPDRSEKAVPFGWRLTRIVGDGRRSRLDRYAIRIGFNQALVADRLLRRQRFRLGGHLGWLDRQCHRAGGLKLSSRRRRGPPCANHRSRYRRRRRNAWIAWTCDFGSNCRSSYGRRLRNYQRMNFGGSLCDGRGLGRGLHCLGCGNFIWRRAWNIGGRPHNPVSRDAN